MLNDQRCWRQPAAIGYRMVMLSPQVIAGARAVAHVADHFERLKLAAADMRSHFGAGDRGYFTPSEDEQVRHLHVSYWQSRNALFELILSYKPEAQPSDHVKQDAFLVAFAAVVLLVDAARYLREQFGDTPAVIDKLNEAEPHFGIPPDSYNIVQQSLTRPLHAWHLYHANQHLLKHRRQLQALADEHEVLQPAMAVIKHLGRRARVSPADYAAARARVRAHQLADLVTKSALGRIVYAVQELAGRLIADLYTQRHHHPALPGEIIGQLVPLLAPGDVMISRKEHAFTNYFLPGYWPHASLYLGAAEQLTALGLSDHEQVRPRWPRLACIERGEPRRVVEAQKDGVWIRSLHSPLTCDALAVIRPRIGQDDVARALVRALFHDGKPYDFDFDFTRSDRLVCTEVVYRAYEGVGGIRFELTRRAGRMTLGAQDILTLALEHRFFEPLAVYAPSVCAELATESQADEVLCSTLQD